MRTAVFRAGMLVVALVLVACTSELDQAEQEWCQNAPAEALDAAAQALNIDPDPNRDFETDRDPSDPVYAQVCQYAYEARDQDLNPPPGNVNPPAEPS